MTWLNPSLEAPYVVPSRATIPDLSEACLAAVLVASMLLASVPVATAEGHSTQDASYLSRPYKLEAIAHDPFAQGIWLGTDSMGLFFRPLDGGPMRIEGVLDGIPDAHILDIDPEPEHVWIATASGPAVLDRATGNWTTFEDPEGNPVTDTSRVVHAAYGHVWAGTDTLGLFELDAATGVATPVPNPVNDTRFDEPVLGIDDDGHLLYLGVPGYGLVEWNRTTGWAKRYGEGVFSRQPNYGRVLVHGSDVWVATSGDGVIRWNRSTDDVKAFIGPATVNAKTVLDMVATGDDIWFAGMGGVARYETDLDHWRVYDRKNDRYAWSNPTDITLADGTIYATTRLEGVVAGYDWATDRFEDQGWWTDRQVPSFNSFMDCETSGDELLLGTSGGGALFYEPATGTWSKIGTHVGTGGHPADVLVRETHQDGETFWFATGQGVSWWNRSTGAWETYRTDGRNVTGVPNDVYDVSTDEQAAWVASFSSRLHTRGGSDAWADGNLARYDKATGTWENITVEDGLPGANVTTVEATAEGVWTGFAGEGLALYHPDQGHFEPVWPTDDTATGVMELIVTEDALYLGTLVHGVVRVDRSTWEASTVFDRDLPVIALEHDAGHLWIGTPGAGIHRLALDTGQTDTYRSGVVEDLFVNCFERAGDVLYVGTQWGLRRLHVPTGAWLPSTLDPSAPTDPRTPEPTIAITQPRPGTRIPAGAALTVQGTSAGPQDARIELQIGPGPWRTIDAHDTFEVQLDVPANASGETTLQARLTTEGAVLARALRTVHVTQGASVDDPNGPEEDPVRIDHKLVLERDQGQPITFTLTASTNASGLEATLVLWAPNSEQPRRIEMAPDGTGRWKATVDPLGTPGEARYRIEATWPGGGARLPGPESGYSATYPLTIRPVEGTPEPRLPASTDPLEAQASQSLSVPITIQNVGTRAGRIHLQLSGDAAPWATGAPDVLELSAAASTRLTIQLHVPTDASPGEHTLTVTALTDDGGQDKTTYNITVQAANEPASTPAPSIAALLATLSLACAITTARSRRP